MPSTRTILIGAASGLAHAAVLLLVALDLGYAVGPAAYTPVGLLWRYGGLVVLAAIPVGLAVRYRLVAPLAALLATTGYVLGMELSPPGPTFVDVAELEGLDEPTGITVVENGLYVVHYMVDASVWLVGFLLLGAVEYAGRTTWDWLPGVPRTIPWLSIPGDRPRAALVAAGSGVVHAAVMLWFAARLGVSVSGGGAWAFALYGVLGMWLLAAVPVYLLVRTGLVGPTLSLAGIVLLDVRAEFTAGVDDPHALYVGAWFLLLGLLLVVAGLEYGLRRLDVARRFRATG